MNDKKDAVPVVGHRGGGSDTAGDCILISMTILPHPRRSGQAETG